MFSSFQSSTVLHPLLIAHCFVNTTSLSFLRFFWLKILWQLHFTPPLDSYTFFRKKNCVFALKHRNYALHVVEMPPALQRNGQVPGMRRSHSRSPCHCRLHQRAIKGTKGERVERDEWRAFKYLPLLSLSAPAAVTTAAARTPPLRCSFSRIPILAIGQRWLTLGKPGQVCHLPIYFNDCSAPPLSLYLFALQVDGCPDVSYSSFLYFAKKHCTVSCEEIPHWRLLLSSSINQGLL